MPLVKFEFKYENAIPQNLTEEERFEQVTFLTRERKRIIMGVIPKYRLEQEQARKKSDARKYRAAKARIDELLDRVYELATKIKLAEELL
jgi:hypothetical protein